MSDELHSVDVHPFHVWLERPAILAVLNPLELSPKTFLDAGCGTGFYSHYAHSQGSSVCALDADPKMLTATRRRLSDAEEVELVQSNLLEPFPLPSNYFDVSVCALTLQLLPDITNALSEFARTLKPRGNLIISLPHPFTTWQQDYFRSAKPESRRFHRPLSDYTEALSAAGFRVERMLEPVPDPAFKTISPKLYRDMCRSPYLLILTARLALGSDFKRVRQACVTLISL